jgi:hypothetical protein
VLLALLDAIDDTVLVRKSILNVCPIHLSPFTAPQMAPALVS